MIIELISITDTTNFSKHQKQLDGVQRKMLGIISGVAPSNDETVERYIRRRAREARRLQREMGSWSDGWAQAICSWDAHLQRPQIISTWAILLGDVLTILIVQ